MTYHTIRIHVYHKPILVFIIITCFILSCGDYRSAFETLVSSTVLDEFPSLDLNGTGTTDNRQYRTIYQSGKKANGYLLDKAISSNKTQWIRALIPVSLTEGDIALILLMDINKIDFYTLLPEELKSDYGTHGAISWWQWIQGNEKIRHYVIDRIKEELRHRDER